MASTANAVRTATRVVHRQLVAGPASRRTIQSSARCLAAQNFSMPALSPTMTEGNIAAWRVKEGDSFSAGDVLLEIETDKATMDVEAQDDGVLWKIMKGDESKAVKVGERIAVTAEQGDDLESLEVPKDEAAASAQQQQPAKEETPKPKEEQKSAASSSGESKSSAPAPAKPATKSTSPSGPAAKAQKQNYPLYPAVMHLLHQNGLSKADADNIPASGPSGRLLKGDVLAYLGRIQKNYPADISARMNKLAHLDLSNIQLAAPTEAPKKAEKVAEVAAPELPQATEIALPISLSAVIVTQKRVQDTLGVFLPLSTFIARASELANEGLPLGKTKPTSGDLFNAVLGLKSPPKISRGNYIPQVVGLSPAVLPLPKKAAKKGDIFDMLISPKKAASPRPIRPAAIGVAADGPNIFSVTAAPGEEKRVSEYLERIKLVLEKEPGRLVV